MSHSQPSIAGARPTRAGMALLAALCGLMLVALLVAGGLASVNAAQRSSATSLAAAILLTSSDDALTDAVAGWRAFFYCSPYYMDAGNSQPAASPKTVAVGRLRLGLSVFSHSRIAADLRPFLR